MTSEAAFPQQDVPSASNAPAVIGRSLGRAARVATVWVGTMTGSMGRVLGHGRPAQPTAAARARADTLLEELATLLGTHSDQRGALIDNSRFWWLVEELYAARYLGISDDEQPASDAVDALVVEQPADEAKPEPDRPRPSKKKAAAGTGTSDKDGEGEQAQEAAERVEDAEEASAEEAETDATAEAEPEQ